MLAIDLASFAVDGGTIFIGVSEDKATDQFTLTPFRLEGVAERLEQLGRLRLDPPLSVRCLPLRAASDDLEGCLVVQIPQSPDALHMVAGIYRGRGEKTNIELGDAEVRRIRTALDRAHEGAGSHLDDWVGRSSSSTLC
jgi:hypothetical protein